MITQEAVIAIRRELSEAEGEKAEHFDVMDEHFEALLDIAEAAPDMYEALRSLLKVIAGLTSYEIDHGYEISTRNDILGDFGELGKDNIDTAIEIVRKAEGKS